MFLQSHPDKLKISHEDIASTVSQALIQALNDELSPLYPEVDARHFRLEAAEVEPGSGIFLVARLDGVPVGCGAIRRLNAETAELKRMYVSPVARGHKIGPKLLAALEAKARQLGYRRLVLETGLRQPIAIAMYERAGYEQIPVYGEYIGTPLSICLQKAL